MYTVRPNFDWIYETLRIAVNACEGEWDDPKCKKLIKDLAQKLGDAQRCAVDVCVRIEEIRKEREAQPVISIDEVLF